MKYLLLLIVISLFFYPNLIKADTIISLKDGTVLVIKGNVSCNSIFNLSDGATCKCEAIIINDGYNWRNWVKENYTPHHSYFNIKRGKIKIIDNKKTVFYKKWFLGKKIVIGNLEN